MTVAATPARVPARRQSRTRLLATAAALLCLAVPPASAQRQPGPEAMPDQRQPPNTAPQASGLPRGEARGGEVTPMRDAPASFASLAKAKLTAVVTITAAGRGGPDGAAPGGPGQGPGQAPGPGQGPGQQGPGGPQFPLPPGNPFEDFLEDFFGRGGPGGPGGPNGGGPARPTRALGSGFIIDPAGYIVTNSHVVENAEEIEVAFQDGRTLEADVVGTDPATDIALLRVESDAPLPTLAWGDSDASEVGDWVIAIGNPFGLGGTVTSGIISARARDIGAGQYDDFLQTDAAINSGNSGGPLIAMDGRVIGVNTAIFSRTGGSIGIGFAIPSAIARNVTQELREQGFVTRGFLGVTIQPVTPEIAEAFGLQGDEGALVSSVTPDSPAARSGLETGDVVRTLNGAPIGEPRDLSRAVADIDPGESVTLGIVRGGEERTLTAQVGELPRGDQVAGAEPGPPGGEGGEGALGLTLAPVTPGAREKFGLEEDVEGAVVVNVNPGSPAAEQGFEPGDVITRANREPIGQPSDLVRAIEEAREQGKETIVVLRRTRQGSVFVPIPLDRQAG